MVGSFFKQCLFIASESEYVLLCTKQI